MTVHERDVIGLSEKNGRGATLRVRGEFSSLAFELLSDALRERTIVTWIDYLTLTISNGEQHW